MATYQSRVSLRAMFLATVIGAGALLIWAVGGVWTSTWVEQWLSRSQPYVSLTITKQGVPLLGWVEYDPPQRIQHYRSLDGRPTDFSGVGLATSAGLSRAPNKPELLSWNQRIAAFSAGTSERREAWYLVHDGAELGGHAYLVGYDDRTKSRLGFLSRSGFRLELPPTAEQFVVDRPVGYGGHASTSAAQFSVSGKVSNSQTANDTLAYLVDETGLYVLNLDKRSVAKAVLPGKVLSVAEIVVCILVTSAAEDGQEARTVEVSEDRVLVLLPERIEMQDSEGRTLLSTPLPKEAQSPTSAILYHLCENNRVVVEVNDDPGRRSPDLFWFDAEGKLERQQRVQLPSSWNEGVGAAAWVPTVIAPTPAFLAIFIWMVPRNYSLADLMPGMILMLVLSVVASVLVYRHSRRYAQGGAAVWAVFAVSSPTLACLGVDSCV